MAPGVAISSADNLEKLRDNFCHSDMEFREITQLQYLPETALCWTCKGKKIVVKIKTLSLFVSGFWWHFKGQHLEPPMRKLGTSIKKIDLFSLDTKAIGAFPAGLEAKSLC